MTVAHLREENRDGSIQVVFLESARFYRLLPENPAYHRMLPQLRQAAQAGGVVDVILAAPESDLIQDLA